MLYAARHEKDIPLAPAPFIAPALAAEQDNKAAAGRHTGVPFPMARNLVAFDFLSLIAAPAVVSVAVAPVVRLFMQDPPDMAPFLATHISLYMPLMLVVMVMLWNKGLYTQRVPWWNQIRHAAKSALFACMIDVGLNASLGTHVPLALIALTWLCALSLLVSLRWALVRLAGKICLWRIPTVVIGNKAMAADLIYAFHADPCLGYDVRTVFLRDRDCDDFDLSSLPFGCRKIQVRDGLDDYDAYIRRNPGVFYIVSLDSFRGERRDRLIRSLEQAGAAFAIVPTTSAMGGRDGADIIQINAYALASVNLSPDKIAEALSHKTTRDALALARKNLKNSGYIAYNRLENVWYVNAIQIRNLSDKEERFLSSQGLGDGWRRIPNEDEAIKWLHHNLTPDEFENFCISILNAHCKVPITITEKHPISGADGGFDGVGEFMIDSEIQPIALQAKRYKPKSQVSEDLCDRFVGALVKRGWKHGFYITTGEFSDRFIESIEKFQGQGIAIEAINGGRLAEIMLKKADQRHGFGLHKTELGLLYINEKILRNAAQV